MRAGNRELTPAPTAEAVPIRGRAPDPGLR